MPYLEPTEEQRLAWAELTQTPWFPLADRGSEILLRQVSPNAWQLTEGFRYEVPESARRDGEPLEYAVPPHDLRRSPEEGNSTDLASVPPWLWWFIASHGKHTRAALLHDHLIDVPEVPDDRADRLFRVALEEADVHFVRRWLMWTAVSLASVARRQGGWSLIGAFALNLLGLFGAAIWWLAGGPVWTGIAAAVLGLAGFIWGFRRWPLSVFGLALIALPTVLIGVAYVVNYVVDKLYYWLSGGKIEPPEFGQPYRQESGPF
jgi:Protein of unknown function (DUF1353)